MNSRRVVFEESQETDRRAFEVDRGVLEAFHLVDGVPVIDASGIILSSSAIAPTRLRGLRIEA